MNRTRTTAILGFLLLSAAAFAQTAGQMDALLDAPRVSFAQAAALVLPAAGLLPPEADPQAAFDQARPWLPRRAEPDAPIRTGELSRLVIAAFGISGGFMYAIFPCPRYAYRALAWRLLLPPGSRVLLLGELRPPLLPCPGAPGPGRPQCRGGPPPQPVPLRALDPPVLKSLSGGIGGVRRRGNARRGAPALGGLSLVRAVYRVRPVSALGLSAQCAYFVRTDTVSFRDDREPGKLKADGYFLGGEVWAAGKTRVFVKKSQNSEAPPIPDPYKGEETCMTQKQMLIKIVCFAAGSIILILELGACDDREWDAPEVFSAAVWNVQALFDGEETGDEYDDYQNAAGWNREKYTARLTALSGALSLLTEKGAPDLVGLVEVENAGVLEDLVRDPLAKPGYTETFFANVPGAALGLGVLSRFPLVEARVHSASSIDGITPRPVLEIRIEPQGKPLILFLCHWKSKLGGEDATEALRRSSARIVRRRLAEILRDEPLSPVLVMGDLNENHDEFYRRNSGVICALFPDGARAGTFAGGETPEDCLILSGEKPPRTRQADAPVLYSPWGRELEDGSYYYKNTWETIDHLLLNDAFFDGRDWDFEGCRVLNTAPFINSAGYPDAYIPWTGRGLSDHLPLVLFLREAR